MLCDICLADTKLYYIGHGDSWCADCCRRELPKDAELMQQIEEDKKKEGGEG